MVDTEYLILKNLICNPQYTKKVAPFLKSEYFRDTGNSEIFNVISGFQTKYGSVPTTEVLLVEFENMKLTETVYNEIVKTVSKIATDKTDPPEYQWLLDTTEKFCKDSALYNAIVTCSDIIDGSNKKLSQSSMPQILSDALSISFDSNIGYDIFEDFRERYEQETDEVNRYKFDIDVLNQITNGGLKPKTLNVFVAGVHVGKTMFMCHLAKNWVQNGYNVLYISMEMSEEEIVERIVANALDIRIKELEHLKKYRKEEYFSKMERYKAKLTSHIVVKQYPTSMASVINFGALLQELHIKKDFKPDVVMIDYINITSPATFKSNDNLYTKIKQVAEELRAYAIMNNVPVFSATQFNKDGQRSSDPEMTDTAESSGLPATCDLLLAGISTDELRGMNKLMFKQLKNRYGDMYEKKRFVVGADYSKARFFDTDSTLEFDDEEEDEQPNYMKSQHKRRGRLSING